MCELKSSRAECVNCLLGRRSTKEIVDQRNAFLSPMSMTTLCMAKRDGASLAHGGTQSDSSGSQIMESRSQT
jgi:hypothetical protein